MKLKKVAVAGFLSLLTAGGIVATQGTAIAAPAQPRSFVVTPKFAGFCPNIFGFGKNSVKRVTYVSYTETPNEDLTQLDTGSSGIRSDVVYPKVKLGKKNVIDLVVECKISTPAEVEIVINPTGSNQVFFVDPRGKVLFQQ